MDTMKRIYVTTLLIIIVIILSGCGILKASPAPDSGFLGVVGKEASANDNFPFHRVWESNQSSQLLSEAKEIEVAPVDLSFLEGISPPRSEAPEVRQSLVQRDDAKELAEFTEKAFRDRLQVNNGNRAEPGYRPGAPELVLELSLVEITPTDVVRNVAGTVLGAFVPGGSVIALGSQGTVAIEGRIKDQSSGKILFAFADRESGKIAPVNLNDLRRYSHAHAIIEDWAEQWAQILASGGKKRIVDTSPVTLLPI